MNKANQWLTKHVHIVYSPFRELVTSLHVLHNPSHHLTRLAWAEEIKSKMAPSLANSLCFFGEVSNEWMNFIDLLDELDIEEKHPEEAIEIVRQVNPEHFARTMLAARVNLPVENLTQNESEFLLKPAFYKQALCDALYEFQQEVFARELFWIEPWLVKAVHELRQKLKEDPAEAIGSVHPRFKVEEGYMKFFKAQTYQFAYEDIDRLTIFPSSFVAPHLMVGFEVPRRITVYLQVPLPEEKPQAGVPDDLMLVLQALGDKSRISLLRTLYYHPYCTQQLAESSGLAKATVSKHLKLLESAGLICPERHGHFVFYSAQKEKLDQLKVDLNQFFDQPLLEKRRNLDVASLLGNV